MAANYDCWTISKDEVLLSMFQTHSHHEFQASKQFSCVEELRKYLLMYRTKLLLESSGHPLEILRNRNI